VDGPTKAESVLASALQVTRGDQDLPAPTRTYREPTVQGNKKLLVRFGSDWRGMIRVGAVWCVRKSDGNLVSAKAPSTKNANIREAPNFKIQTSSLRCGGGGHTVGFEPYRRTKPGKHEGFCTFKPYRQPYRTRTAVPFRRRLHGQASNRKLANFLPPGPGLEA